MASSGYQGLTEYHEDKFLKRRAILGQMLCLRELINRQIRVAAKALQLPHDGWGRCDGSAGLRSRSDKSSARGL